MGISVGDIVVEGKIGKAVVKVMELKKLFEISLEENC